MGNTYMHMSDALLSPAVGLAFGAASAGLALHSARRIGKAPDEQHPAAAMGVVGAFVFSAQMINIAIPGTGSSGHLAGGFLLAVLLGPHRAFLAMASILLVQALLFADGGLLAYGCNLFNLGFWPCFVIYPLLFRPLLGAAPSARRVAALSFAGGFLSLLLGALGVAVETSLSGMTALPFGTFALTLLAIHAAIGAGEGLATAAVIGFVRQAAPEWLPFGAAAPVAAMPTAPRRRTIGAFLLAAVVAGGMIAWFASPKADGLEWSVARVAGAEPEHEAGRVHAALADAQAHTAFLPDYGFASAASKSNAATDEAEAWPAVSAGTSAAGVVGTLVTLALAAAVGLAARAWRRTDP